MDNTFDAKAADARLETLAARHIALAPVTGQVGEAFALLHRAFAGGHKLLVGGNGGSAADAEHIVGELMKGFCRPRALDEGFARRLREADPENGPLLGAKLQGALPAIALSGHSSLQSAFLNDVDGQLALAQQVYGFGAEGDVFWAISTSGNAVNLCRAAAVARAKGMAVLALTGEGGGWLGRFADVAVKVPGTETYMIQELHLPVYHCLCLMLEDAFFGAGG